MNVLVLLHAHVITFSSLQNVELLLKPLALHPVECKSVVDKFAAVGILQVKEAYLYSYSMRYQLILACFKGLKFHLLIDEGFTITISCINKRS